MHCADGLQYGTTMEMDYVPRRFQSVSSRFSALRSACVGQRRTGSGRSAYGRGGCRILCYACSIHFGLLSIVLLTGDPLPAARYRYSYIISTSYNIKSRRYGITAQLPPLEAITLRPRLLRHSLQPSSSRSSHLSSERAFSSPSAAGQPRSHPHQ